ncbi:MAG: shikimate kinase [Ignavibacteriales bacterium]|nr:shikimate kinase [Ignavibacteriales bacterium]
MNEKRIYLTGFMTSGKSTIGPILANVLGLEFFDLDKVIENEEKQTIVEIFEKKGEAYFRELEYAILHNLSEREGVVISLGGGTLTSQTNFDFLKSTGKIIYLKVSPNNLYKRLKNKVDRPLFRDLVLSEKNEEVFLEKIKELLEKRRMYYEKADLIIDTDLQPLGKTVDKIAKRISVLINEKD